MTCCGGGVGGDISSSGLKKKFLLKLVTCFLITAVIVSRSRDHYIMNTTPWVKFVVAGVIFFLSPSMLFFFIFLRTSFGNHAQLQE